jgi:hypothetical protein
VREDVDDSISSGPDPDPIAGTVRARWEPGFTDATLVQIRDEGQGSFLEEAGTALRTAAG